MSMFRMAMLLAFASLISFTQVQAEQSASKELAIVIDDFGNGMKGTEEMLDLPAPLTVAVMPFLSTTHEDARNAHSKGHEVIVHLPMEPKKGKISWLGPGAITTDLSDEEIREKVEKAIADVPHAVGMNHHMGSKVTEDERVMRIILEVCKEKGFYYLDSKTTGKSVIPRLASELGVPYLENDLFFDHVYSLDHIQRQAAKLGKNLEKREQIIAIGHVGVTGDKVVGVLAQHLPKYQQQAELVPASALLKNFYRMDETLP
ncbi:divergent polysaccharide deacetylase family protein [Mesobacillus maritimus]|uniref:divergent polysaccharide deacetylase family protein n=1 Tax=Mesobacillus maritimus TaxID=1643336 RepID=UPI00203BBDCE|nr:divergent polysaccharide deacetylase family protein [Mesobacillus maritimus]MCM3585305.1 divergent polysaccharide deacetylase family protein [Mesobacillus maritimus]